MDIKEKLKNIDTLDNQELVELIEFYLGLVNKSFCEAEQCKTCTESCCDIFKNNYKQVLNILNLISNHNVEINDKEKDKEKDEVEKESKSKKTPDTTENDYLISLEINNLEKKYL